MCMEKGERNVGQGMWCGMGMGMGFVCLDVRSYTYDKREDITKTCTKVIGDSNQPVDMNENSSLVFGFGLFFFMVKMIC